MLAVVIIALGVALGLAALWGATRARSAATMALLWLAYAGYEFLMHARVLCSGECNIRVDLLLIWPALLLGTLAMLALRLWQWLRARRAATGR